MPNDKSLFVWRVRCINRQSREFFDRDMVLDQASVPAEELPEVMRILNLPNPGGKQQIAKYRRYFREVTSEELDALVAQNPDHFDMFYVMEYFEDENGNPLSTLGMMQAKTGEEHIIVLGDLESVLRYGPTDMAKPVEWSVEKANILTHFLEVTDCLAASKFLRSKSSYTQVVGHDGTRQVTGFERPDVLVVNSVLAFVRQLISQRDNLFNTAVATYLDHCSHDGKRLWIGERRHSLTRILDSKAFPLSNEGFTCRQLLSLFFYAFGLLHRPEQEQMEEFRESITNCGREKLVGAFHFTCVNIMAETYNAGHVIRQDLLNWLANGHAKPQRVGIIDLFGQIDRE